tara:strand:- start:556 stop:840 length:285 start_codon:yes stop_codon:yes gene_type:complete
MDNILNKVNRVATLRAQIAEMAKEEKELISEMKDFGTGVYQGTKHQIIISERTQETLDMKAAKAKLSRQFIQAYTKKTTTLVAKLDGYSKKEVA